MERKHHYNRKSTIIRYFRKAAELYEQKAFVIDTEKLRFGSKINVDERRHYEAESSKSKTLSDDYETIAIRMTQSGESIYRTGYGKQNWNFQNKFNPDYAKKYNWQKTQSLKTKFQRLIDTHDFYFLTVCIKQINEKELTEKTNQLKSLWQPLKYELQKQFDGAYGMIEFDYGYTTENGKTITTYQPHIHYWLTIKKNTKINKEAFERKITEILEKHFKGSVKTGVEIHQHFNAVEKAGYVHKWRFIGSDYGNKCDTPKNENEMIRNTLILIALYEASKGLRPLYYGTLSNRGTGSRIYNNKIKEINNNTEKDNNNNDTEREINNDTERDNNKIRDNNNDTEREINNDTEKENNKIRDNNNERVINNNNNTERVINNNTERDYNNKIRDNNNDTERDNNNDTASTIADKTTTDTTESEKTTTDTARDNNNDTASTITDITDITDTIDTTDSTIADKTDSTIDTARDNNNDTASTTDTTDTTESTIADKTTKDTDGIQITCHNANRTLLTALLTAILLTRRLKIGMPRNGYHKGGIQIQTTKHKPP